MRRYLMIEVEWKRCLTIRTPHRLTRREYVGEVLAIKYGH